MSIDSVFPRDANRVPITAAGLVASKAIVYAILTTGAVGATTLFTVTGDVLVKVFAKCTEDLNSDGAATLEVGTADNTAILIAQTAYSAIDNKEIWNSATPAIAAALGDWKVLQAGTDIIQTIATETVKDGELTYYCLWVPLSADGNVVAA